MALAPGDILFVGWDSDNDDITFVVTTDLDPSETIYFTDDEWDGTSFNGGEQYMEWTTPAGGVPAGTVITVDMDRVARTATLVDQDGNDPGGTFDYMRGGYDIAGGNEMFWAFQGTRTGNIAMPDPDGFISVIGNEDNNNSNQSPNLTNTGLIAGDGTNLGAIIIDGDEDYMEYTADAGLPNPLNRDDLIASVVDPLNWTTADGGGNNNPNGTGFDIVFPEIVCFVAGARLATPDGPRPVEDLRPGDLVTTRDHGPKPLRWAGRREITANGRFAPIEFTAGALGDHGTFRVSPQHRMLLTGWRAELLFGDDEVLVPAKALINDTTIRRVPGGQVTYVHVLFDAHEIVDVEGCPTESMLPAPRALSALDRDAQAEIVALFPELAAVGSAPARPVVRSRIGRLASPAQS